MYRLVITLSLLISFLSANFSQEISLKFNHLSRNDGLSSNRVNYIFEDSDGFMWFGTEDGLTKYDGYSCTVYRNDPNNATSIRYNTIDVIVEDTLSKNLIIATPGGLVYFDQSIEEFRTIFDKELRISNRRNFGISSMVFDQNNYLWIDSPKGLFRADLENMAITNYFVKYPEVAKSFLNSNIISLTCLNDGIIGIGHEEGLELFDPVTNTITSFHPEAQIKDVEAIFRDNNMGMWIGSNVSGLYYFPNPDQDSFRHFSKESGHLLENRVHGIIEMETGSLVIIVRDGGLHIYNQKLKQFNNYIPDIHDDKSINSKAVISLTKSSQGIIWIGTYNSGVNYIDQKNKKFEHFKVDFSQNGLFNNNIRALYEDREGYIWIGTKEEGGLSRFDRRTKTFKNYKQTDQAEGLNDDYIFSISELDSDHLLIGTFTNGMAVFNKKTETFRYYVNDLVNPSSINRDRIHVIYRDLESRIWVGGQSFLQEFEPISGNFRTIPEVRSAKCMEDEDMEKIWVGTSINGVYLFNKTENSFKHFRYDPEDNNTILSNEIFALKKDTKGRLWIGTKHGLCFLDTSNDSITRFTEQEGLPSNWICGIELDNDGNVWISTINGLSKLDQDNWVFHNFDVDDGLQGNEFESYVSLKTRDGQMLFGGRNGFNMFVPEEIIDNTKMPTIVLTGFKIYNKEVPIGQDGSPLGNVISRTDKLKLKHNQSAITIEYTALNYTSSEKNRYKYLLDGFDKEWIDAGFSRNAIYTNIPPGNYTFNVIASNNDGYWNEKGVALNIEVLPPPWKTNIAYLVYVLILVGSFLLIRRTLVIRINQKQLIEFERKEKQRIQELNQLKLRFFTNISHEFRTPLSLISGPLEKLMTYKSDNDEQKYLLKLMQNNVKRLLLLINELMDFRKAENAKLKLHVSQNDPQKIVAEIIQCFNDIILDNDINLQFNSDLPEKKEYWFDNTIIDKVLFNLLSNALKYTPRGGRITIDLKLNQEHLEISVSDTGKGILKEDLEGIFERFFQVENSSDSNIKGSGIGLSFSKRLIEVHHGTIEVESLVNIGSRFSVHFPASQRFYNSNEIYDTSHVKNTYPLEISHLNNERIANENKVDKENRKQIKILIVEDNLEMKNFLLSNLNMYTLFEADNGKIGYNLALKEIPDIVISDVMMPEMDGLEMCSKIKIQIATSHIPVILLSAKTDVIHKIEGAETGADAYIEKPFNLEYLLAIIKNLLKKQEILRQRLLDEPEVEHHELELTSYEKKFIEKTIHIIGENIENSNFSVEMLGSEIGLSRSQLFRKFKTLYGLKPSELIRTERLKKAKTVLLTREYNINEVAYQTGFKSASYFITSFKKEYGETPNEYINRLKKKR